MSNHQAKPFNLLVIPLAAVSIAGCGGGGGSSGGGGNSTLASQLTDYIGTWQATCTTEAPAKAYTLSINSNGQYWMVTREYDDAANCGDDAHITNQRIDTSEVTSVQANDNNSAYNDLYIDNDSLRLTPHSSAIVSAWISSQLCGKTDWSVDSEAEFDANNTGNTCFQPNTRPAVRLSGTNLLLNGRGGFDGGDPADTVFTKQSSSPLLTGKIGGEPWMAVSGKVSAGFDAGTLSYTLYDTYVPDICNNFFFSSRGTVLFSLPEATGNYSLGLSSNTVTLYDGTTNYIVTSGEVDLNNLTTSLAEGSVDATYNSSNSVTGEFHLTRCP